MNKESEDTNNKTVNQTVNRRQILKMLAAVTGTLVAPGLARKDSTAPLTSSLQPQSPASDRLGVLLPQRKMGNSGISITNLGVGGDHIGNATEKDAQAIIETSLQQGVRFFDNAPFYRGGLAESRYGKFLCPAYRDVSFIMSETLAKTAQGASNDLAASLSRMKTDYLDLWQIHALQSPEDVVRRIENGVLDVFIEAQQKGLVKHIGFTGHQSCKAHRKMVAELKRLGVSMDSAQMPINPADPHYESFILNVVPECINAGIGILAMKTLAYGRFFGGTPGWRKTNVMVKPATPDAISLEDIFGFVWSLPVSTLVSGMERVEHVVNNAALARKTWNWSEAQRQRRIEAVKAFAGPELEFYKG